MWWACEVKNGPNSLLHFYLSTWALLFLFCLSHQREGDQFLSRHAVDVILRNPKSRREKVTQHRPANMDSPVNTSV